MAEITLQIRKDLFLFTNWFSGFKGWLKNKEILVSQRGTAMRLDRQNYKIFQGA